MLQFLVKIIMKKVYTYFMHLLQCFENTYTVRPGVEYPMNVHSIGLELNCEVFNSSFIIAVLNSVGVNVTVMHILPWAGIIPVTHKNNISHHEH